ncbi:MAG: hypothetical protein ACK4V6_10540 [Microthrixaceae bacterium]
MSVDERIRERLETLVEPVDEQAVLARIDQLAASSPPAAERRPGRRVMLGAAAAVAVVVAIGIGVAQMGDGPGRAEVLAGPDSTAPTGSDVAPEPAASVEVRGERLGAIEVTTSQLIAAGDDHDEDLLGAHVLTFTNTGDTSVFLDDLRASAALSADPDSEVDLFVGTEGCGVSYGSGVPVMPSCNRNYDPVGELAPGDSVELGVFLRSAVAGLAPLDD